MTLLPDAMAKEPSGRIFYAEEFVELKGTGALPASVDEVNR